jgi:zinc transporter 1
VFLLALCFTLIISAVQRFIETVRIDDPRLVLIVGSIGLFINVVGMVFFHEAHGHSHSHSGGGGHSHDHKEKKHDHDHSSHSHATIPLDYSRSFLAAE